MKKWLSFLLIFLSLIALISLMVLTSIKNKDRRCEQLNIYIDYQNGDHLLTSAEIRKLILENFDTIEGQLIREIDLLSIKNLIETIPATQEANLVSQIGGEIEIRVKQRIPIARLIDESGSHYYLDNRGFGFMVHQKYSSHQMIVNGDIGSLSSSTSVFHIDTIENAILKDTYEAAKQIFSSPFWKSQIVQIYYSKDQGIEMVPRIGDFIILFGDVNDFEQKLIHLSAFFKQGLSSVGWNTYKHINLKFENQIICTKH